MDEFIYEHEKAMNIRLEIIEDLSGNNIALNDSDAIDNYYLDR